MYLIRNQAYRKVPWVRIPPSPPKICFLPSTTVQKNTLKALVLKRNRGFLLSCAHCSAIKFKFQLGCGLPTAALLSGGKISHLVRWCTAPDRCKLLALLIVFQTLLLCSRRPSSSPHLRCVSVLKQRARLLFVCQWTEPTSAY